MLRFLVETRLALRSPAMAYKLVTFILDIASDASAIPPFSAFAKCSRAPSLSPLSQL